MAWKHRVIRSLLKVTDLMVAALSIILAIVVTEMLAGQGEQIRFLDARFSLPEILGGLLYLGLVHFVFLSRGLYESYRFAAAAREVRDIGIVVAVSASLLLPFALAAHPRVETGVFVGCFAVLAFVLLGVERRGLRAIARHVRHRGHNLRNVLIVASQDGNLGMTSKLARREELGLHVVGVIAIASDRPALMNRELQRVRQALENHPVDELLIDLPLDRGDALVQGLVSMCEERGVTVRIIAQVAKLQWAHAVVDELDGQPVLTLSSAPIDSVSLSAKRAIDVMAAFVGMVLLSPVFLLIAMAIKFDSAGPVFFHQERIGCNHRLILTHKFRTMSPDAEARQCELEQRNEAAGPVFKIRNDPRITRVGKWLRRSSLDELPQLANVLFGEMSLVGPRPLPVRDVNNFSVPAHHRRFCVRPGITCAWQASHRTPEFDRWVQSDLEYIDHWSLALDFKILMQTIPAVVSGRGAC